MALLLETDLGDLVVDLDVEGSPALAKNILKLAKARFYTKTLIHSVTPNRFCQLGCPVGDGTGGSSIYGLLDSNDDYRKSSKRFLKSSSIGRTLTPAECLQKGRVVACLAGGNIPNTIGSQFLITTAEGPDCALDGYSLTFPTVSSGDDNGNEPSGFLSLGVVAEDSNDVLDKINEAYTDPNGRPYADIRILRALVVVDPFEDPPGMGELLVARGVVLSEKGDSDGGVMDSPSPERPAEEVVPARISINEVKDEQDVEDEAVLRAREEATQRKEDRSRAVVLEMLGDLPDADIKAPENVLFICKLNPVTQDEDLELIFSRFDPTVKVEIIRDHDTGASLQYAFAEFTKKEQAEEAYFKMDNALVDDRRIKVDFSQSVSKIWDKYNQKQRMPRGGYGGDFPADKIRRSNGRGHPREHNLQRSEKKEDEFGRLVRVGHDRQGQHRDRSRVSDRVDSGRHRRLHSREDDASSRGRNDEHHRRPSSAQDHNHPGHYSSSSESRDHTRRHKRDKRSRRVDAERESYHERRRDHSISRDERVHNRGSRRSSADDDRFRGYDEDSNHESRHSRSHRERGRRPSSCKDERRHRRESSEESYRRRKRHKEHRRHDKVPKSKRRSRDRDREPRGDRFREDDRKRHRARHRSPSQGRQA